MKKIYLSALFLGMIASANAQEAAQKMNDLQLNEVAAPTTFAPKALGVEVWNNNFDNPADWTIDNDGQTGAAFGWTIDATSDGWWSANGITSTSGGNFAELSNGDPQTGSTSPQALNVVYTMTTAMPIDVVNAPANTANTSDVTLQYQEFGARFNDLQEVQISTDGGTTWTTVRNNLDYSVLSASGGSAYANPENVSINLAPYLDNTTAQNLLIRFSWTTNFPSLATNPNVWIAYGWYIDDVKIVTNPDNDIEVTSNYFGSEGLYYYQIPTTQVAPIDFSANVFNGGINAQDEVQLNVSVDGTAFGSSAAGNTIASGASDSIFLTTPYTPAATVGSHTITQTITQTQVDDVPTNNVISDYTFQVTDLIYARDNGTADGQRGNQGLAFESGNLFDIWADQQVRAIDVQLHNTTNVGTFIYGKIYSIDAATGDFIEEGVSDYHEVTAQDLTGTVTLELYSWVQLTAATQTYLVVVGSDGDGGTTNDLVVKTAGASEIQTTFFKDESDTWFYSTATPMVRLNFNPTIGLNENVLEGVSIYPNPSEGIVTVSNDNNTTNTIEVFNLVGERVYSTTASTSTQIDLSANGTGVYIVKVYNEKGSFVERVVIK